MRELDTSRVRVSVRRVATALVAASGLAVGLLTSTITPALAAGTNTPSATSGLAVSEVSKIIGATGAPRPG